MFRHYSGPMACFRDALMDAGIDASDLPAGVDFAQARQIAEEHGIIAHYDGGNITLGEEPVIVVYDNHNGRTAHAVYHASPAEIDSSRTVLVLFSGLWNWK